MRLLAKVVANNTASFDWELPPGFARFIIYSPDYRPTTNQQDLQVQVSTDGGSNYAASGYRNAAMWAVPDNNGHTGGHTAGAILNLVGTANDQNASFRAVLTGIEAGRYFRVVGKGMALNTNNLIALFFCAAQYDTNTDRVTHIRVAAVAGNITSGTIYLYGEE